MKLLIACLFILSIKSHANFSSEDSASVNITGGNTDLKTYALKSSNSYKWNKNIASISGNYNYGESNTIRNSENWNVGIRYDFIYSKKITFYTGEIIEADRFAGIKRRYNTDLGFKRSFIDTDTIKLFTELGYRYTIQKSIETTRSSKARAYLETSKTFKKDLSGKLWLEYLPNLSDSNDYFINLEPSLTVALTSIFSMKTAYLWKYNNFPSVSKGKHDYNYTLSLISKF